MWNELYLALNRHNEFVGLQEFGFASWLNHIEISFDEHGKVKDTERFGNGHFKGSTVDESFKRIEEGLFSEKEELEHAFGRLVLSMQQIELLEDFEVVITEEKQTKCTTSITFHLSTFEYISFVLNCFNGDGHHFISFLQLTNKSIPVNFRNIPYVRSSKHQLFINQKEIMAKVMQNSTYRELFQSLKVI